MADKGIIRMRLLRDTATPPSPDGSDWAFGLQDNKERLHEGYLQEDGGKLAFDFDLRVAPAADEQQPPVFTGPFAFGRPQDRFVYLSWQRASGPGYINRIKARLADIDWALVHDAQQSGGRLQADLSGRKAGGGKVPVTWTVVDRQPAEHEEAEQL